MIQTIPHQGGRKGNKVEPFRGTDAAPRDKRKRYIPTGRNRNRRSTIPCAEFPPETRFIVLVVDKLGTMVLDPEPHPARYYRRKYGNKRFRPDRFRPYLILKKVTM